MNEEEKVETTQEEVQNAEPVVASPIPAPTPGVNKKGSKLPLILVVVLLLAAGGYFLYTQMGKKNTPKEIFISSIENVITKTSNIKEKSFNTLSDSFTISAKVSSPFLDKGLLDVINKLKLSGKVEVDKKNETYYVKLDSTYDNATLLKLSAYMKDNSLYMMFDDILNKWIKLEYGDSSIITATGEEEFLNNTSLSNLTSYAISKIERFSNIVVDALKDALKDEYFEKEKLDDGSKITLTIDDNNYTDILIDTLTSLKKSKDFKNLYKEIMGAALTDKDIDETIKALKSASKPLDGGKIVAVIYTNSKNEFKKIDITIKTNGEETGFELELVDDDTLEFAIKTQGIKFISGSIAVKENGDDNSMKFTLSMMEMINIELNIDQTIKYDGKLENIDLSNSVNADKLTEADEKKLEDITNSEGFKKLIRDIENLDLTDMMSSLGLDNTPALSF